MKIYDPTVGSGGMLIQTRNYLKDKCKQNSIDFLRSAFSIEDAKLLLDIGCN